VKFIYSIQSIQLFNSWIARCSSTWVALSFLIYCCKTWALLAIAFLLAIYSCISHKHSFSWWRRASSTLMIASISSSESCYWSSWAFVSWSWVGYRGGSSGFPVSAVAMWGSMDVCGWAIAWVVSRTWTLAAWDEPSAGRSFLGFLLGGISWVFCGISWVFSRAHKLWAPMLEFDHQRLANSYGKVNGTQVRERERERHWKQGKWLQYNPPPLGGARVGLFIGEVKVHITMH
jgi:hypothetical protein